MKRVLSQHIVSVLTAAVVIVIAVAGAAYAAGGGGRITVCVSKANGTLYKAKRCGSRASKLSWNIQGPQGAPGARGSNATVTAPSWTALSLENGWSTAGYGNAPAQFAKDQFGFVHLRGAIAGGSDQVVGVLPVGDRPAYDVWEVDYGYRGSYAVAVVIRTTGTISVFDIGDSEAITNATSFTSLEGISFSTSS